MLLAIDIGNTHTVIGLFDGATMRGDWRLASLIHRTADENWLLIRSFCEQAGADTGTIRSAGISSVVPDLTAVYETLCRKYLRLEPVTISADSDLGFTVRYNDPRAVGADRLCNAAAGFRKFGGPLIIIDFGTATTFDVVAANGDYLGGVIALGLESMAVELHRRAAKLPRIELRFPGTVIGRDTITSIQAGVMFGTVEAVEGIVRRIRVELGAQARVIATGGLAPAVALHTNVIEAIEPTLVLEGIRLIAQRSI